MRHRDSLILILVVLAAFRIAYIYLTPFGLSPDEAHYWEWSRRLDLSYYSKGPGVAYVIAFFTSVFGPTVVGVRIGAVVFSTLASYILYLFSKELFESEKAGFYSALILNITPIFSIGSVLMTTDVLFIFFWTAAVWCIKKALDGVGAGWWYASGIMAGLGFLSKYTMVLIYPAILLMLLASGEKKWLKRPEPYISAFIGFILSTPVIFWNITHGQVTIRHTMGQAHVGTGGFSIIPSFEFLASQFGLVTPLLLLGFAYGVGKAGAVGFRENRRGLLLAFFASAPLFLFFLLASLHGKVQANWAIASYVTAAPLSVWAFGRVYDGCGEGGKKLLKALAALALITGTAASALFYFPWGLEALGAKKIISGPPYNRVTGWRELGEKVSDVKDEMERAGKAFIMSDTYQITSELAFYARGNPVTYNFDTGSRRMNQYDLWPGFEDLKGLNAIYVKGGVADVEAEVASAFDRCDREIFTVFRRDKPLKEFSIFRCYGFKGIKKAQAIKSY